MADMIQEVKPLPLENISISESSKSPDPYSTSLTLSTKNTQASSENLKRIQNVIHIKHPPPRAASKKDAKTEIFLTPSTPIVSALKRVAKVMESLPKNAPKAKFISVRGLGKAMDRAIIVAIRLQQQGKTVSFHTGTVTVVDEYESAIDPTSAPSLKSRKVSSIEIRVYTAL